MTTTVAAARSDFPRQLLVIDVDGDGRLDVLSLSGTVLAVFLRE